MIKIAIGDRVPTDKLPPGDCATMNLNTDGLTVICKVEGLTKQEKKKYAFRGMSYLEPSQIPVPIALFIFDFGFADFECPFDARLVDRKIIDWFLVPEEGELKNSLSVFLVNNGIIESIKLVGLEQEAMKLFHATIKKQLANPYPATAFNVAYSALISNYSTDVLKRQGRWFPVRKNK